MQLSVTTEQKVLDFCFAAKTSRGVLSCKQTTFIKLFYKDNPPQQYGIGECNTIPNLSIDALTFHNKLQSIADNVDQLDFPHLSSLADYPALRFALEMAYIDLQKKNHDNMRRILFPSKFTDGFDSIPINGLIWMGGKDFQKQQIQQKITENYKCIKLKIGASNLQEDIDMISFLQEHPLEQIRLDANGAYTKDTFLSLLDKLNLDRIHSVEQPIPSGKEDDMAYLCKHSPVPIALDEELIGKNTKPEKEELLAKIQPQFIILKPSLLGGFASCLEWIQLAKQNNIAFWVTSALESNVGLNAIAQWTYTLQIPGYQGLGTGMIYKNNTASSLYIQDGRLKINCNRSKFSR